MQILQMKQHPAADKTAAGFLCALNGLGDNVSVGLAG